MTVIKSPLSFLYCKGELMNQVDSLVTYYEGLVDELRVSLLANHDPFVVNAIDVDITYFLGLIHDRVSFVNSQG